MLADKFYKFLESIDNDISISSIIDYGEEIYFDGHIQKDKLEKFLKKIEYEGFQKSQDEIQKDQNRTL